MINFWFFEIKIWFTSINLVGPSKIQQKISGTWFFLNANNPVFFWHKIIFTLNWLQFFSLFYQIHSSSLDMQSQFWIFFSSEAWLSIETLLQITGIYIIYVYYIYLCWFVVLYPIVQLVNLSIFLVLGLWPWTKKKCLGFGDMLLSPPKHNMHITCIVFNWRWKMSTAF